MTKQTDEEIRAEFDAAAARQALRNYPARQAEDTNTERLDYSSAGAVRKR